MVVSERQQGSQSAQTLRIYQVLRGSSGKSSLFVTKKGMAERKMRACQLLNLMIVRWGPVKLGYSLNSLEGNDLFLQDFRNEKQKLNYKN